MRIKQSHVKLFRYALLTAGISQELSYRYLSNSVTATYLVYLSATAAHGYSFQPGTASWFGWRPSSVAPYHPTAQLGRVALALRLLALQRMLPLMQPPVSPNRGVDIAG